MRPLGNHVGDTTIPKRDLETETCVSGPVITRQMTPEERAYVDSLGQPKKFIYYPDPNKRGRQQ